MILTKRKFVTVVASVCVVQATIGCSKKPPVAPKSAQKSQQSATPAGPSITPLPDEAEWLHNAMGYIDVIAYEFAGTWLACWLECEVDGELAERTPEKRVRFDDFDEIENVRGWITVWGTEHKHLNLNIRAQYVRGDRTSFSGILPAELEIPRHDSPFRLGSGGLDAGWTGRLELPDKADEEFVIHSYQWEEQDTADGPTVRRVRVLLKAKRLPLENADEAATKT